MCLTLFTFVLNCAWTATNQTTINTSQTIILQDGQIVPNTNRTIVPSNTEFILNYNIDISILPEKDSIIDCEIAFPQNLNVKLLSCSPIQMLTVDKKEEPAFATYESKLFKYYEFLIPSNSRWCNIQFAVKIPEGYSKSIPIDFNYEILKKTFLMKYGGMKIGIASGIASTLALVPGAGAAVGAIAGVMTKDSNPIANSTTRINSEADIPNKTNQDIFQKMKNQFKVEQIHNSSAHFSMHVNK